MPTPHKHAEMIKAWADGETIHYKYIEGFEWNDCNKLPLWNLYNEYRIKPKETVSVEEPLNND